MVEGGNRRNPMKKKHLIAAVTIIGIATSAVAGRRDEVDNSASAQKGIVATVMSAVSAVASQVIGAGGRRG